MIGKHVVIDTLDNFKTKLSLIPSSAIVLIKDVGQIYAHGTYFGAQKTYELLNLEAAGLAPAGGINANGLISNVDSEWVLTVTNGKNPVWKKLPANAFSNDSFELKAATTTDLGGIKVGSVYNGLFSTLTGKHYAVNVDNAGLAYVSVPWDFTDLNVKQTSTSLLNEDFSLLFSHTADDSTHTEGTRKASNLKFNPSTGTLTTTILKGNLDGSYINKLTGYSKASTKGSISTNDSLNTALGKLEHKADVVYDLVDASKPDSTTIDTLREVLNVLSGITDTLTIQGILGNYVTLSGTETITGTKTFSKPVTIEHTLKITSYQGPKYILMGNLDSGGVNNPFVITSSNGRLVFHNGDNWSGNGGTLTSIIEFSKDIITSYTSIKATKFVTTDGTSSQFVKGDGSLDSTSYLPTTGGVLNSGKDTPLTIKGTVSAWIKFINKEDQDLGWIGVESKHPYFYSTDTSGYKIWHAGNDGHDSGLDADTLDSLHASSFFKLSDGGLISNSSDLNTYTTVGTYSCVSDSSAQSLANCPVDHAFRLVVSKPLNGADYILQELTVYWGSHEYTRVKYNIGLWSAWEQRSTDLAVYKAPSATVADKATTADIASLLKGDWGNPTIAVLSALMYSIVSKTDVGSLPANSNANGLLTINTHPGNYYHQLALSSNGNLYHRSFINEALNNTKEWKQVAFTDSDITGDAHSIDGKHAKDFMHFGGCVFGEDGSPFSYALTYFADLVEDLSMRGVYNYNGREYSLLFSKNTHYGSVLRWGYSTPYIYIGRYASDKWQTTDWEKIHSGYSDTTGKLNTAVSLWGLRFDGSSDISGHLYIKNNYSINNYDSEGNSYRTLLISSANEFLIGHDSSQGGIPTYIHGKTVNLRYDGAKEGLILNQLGNVGIGTTTPSYKLQVAGTAYVEGTLLVGNDASNNYMAFYGTTGDGAAGFSHTYIGEHATGTNELSELIFYKGNDHYNNGSGPDRIRHIAAQHVFQIYKNQALSGSFIDICTSTVPENILAINHSNITSYVSIVPYAGNSYNLGSSSAYWSTSYCNINICNKLGIGVTPQHTLHVKGNSLVEGIFTIKGTNSSFQQLILKNSYTDTVDWDTKIISDYYGSHVYDVDGFRHGLFITLGRENPFDNLYVMDYSGSPITRISKYHGHYFDGNFEVTETIKTKGLFINTSDATLKFYSGKTSDGNNDGTICLQTCFDAQDGETHSYASSTYQYRENIVLLPRAGLVYIGYSPTTQGNTNYKLSVYGHTFSEGYTKKDSSDDYVLLGGGGHKSIADLTLGDNTTEISKSLTVTLDWMDTGIKYNDIPSNGSYMVLVIVSANDTTGNMWDCYFTGMMSWFVSEGNKTNDNEADEIILHRSGHAYHNTIYLRTVMTLGGASSSGLKLLIASNTNIGKAYTYTFKFKRII